MNESLAPPSGVATVSPASSNEEAIPSMFLALKLGTEEYGLDILRVQEIHSSEEPTRLANALGVPQGRNQPARCDHAHYQYSPEVQPGTEIRFGSNILKPMGEWDMSWAELKANTPPKG